MISLGDWRELPFHAAFHDATAGNSRAEQRDYLPQGKLAVVDQGHGDVAGYVNDLALKCNAPLPCLVFGDHTKIVKYVDHPFAIGAQGVRVLVPSPQLDARFAYYALKRVRFPSDTGYSRHSRFLRRSRIAFPPIREQRRIVALLNKADGIRRKRRESIGLLEEFLRSAFLEMFGDPVRNEKGWEVVAIGDVTTDTQYGTSAKANSEGLGLPVLRMGNITVNGAIDLTDMKWCEIAQGDLAAYTVQRGDLLFNRTNSPELVGKAALWERGDPYAFAGYLVRVRFDHQRALPEFVSAFLNSAQGKRMLLFRAKPSNNMSNISASELRRLPIPLPPLAEQRRFAKLRSDVLAVHQRVDDGHRLAGELFDSLAQRAFEGDA
jgi:type I restriction enzyme S subunit